MVRRGISTVGRSVTGVTTLCVVEVSGSVRAVRCHQELCYQGVQ
jgi:hypothetical protein